MRSRLTFPLTLALATILSPAVFAQNSPSDLAASLGLDPTFPQTPQTERGLGVSGDRVFQPGAQPALGIQWCSEVAPEPPVLAAKAYTEVSSCTVPVSVPLGTNGTNGQPTWAFSITFMATVEAKNKGFGALVMNITDELLLMGANGTNVEQDFTATPGFNPETVTLDGDNIPAHDPMLVTVWVYNGTKQNWQLQMRGPAPGSLGGGRASTLGIRMWNN